MSRAARFRQAEVTRALKGAKAAGFSSVRVEIMPDGRLTITPTKGGAPGPSDWDEVLA